MINDILSGIPWGLFLSFMIGPVFFILLETSIIKGFRAAFIFNLGVVSADILFIGIAYLGSYRLIQNLQDKPSLFIFGGILMVVYGIISFVNLKKESKMNTHSIDNEIIKKNYGSLYIKGFFLNTLNPAIWLLWLGNVTIISKTLNYSVVKMIFYLLNFIIKYHFVN